MDLLSALNNYLGGIIYGGGNQFASPQVGFQMTPDMQSIARQNPSLSGQNFAGATTAGAMPNAPNTAQMSQMANPQPPTQSMGSAAFGPLMGLGLGYMGGGPRGALRGAALGGAEEGLLAMGQPQMAMMAPLALRALGLG